LDKKGKSHSLEVAKQKTRLLPIMTVKTTTSAILENMPEVNKWQADFITKNIELQCQLRGRHNFTNMSRYSDINEGTFHNNYSKDFDFFEFNRQLVKQSFSSECINAFDPSFISKSGKKTPGLGYFWSGCAGKAKIGLEIGGFASVDILNNTALHLIADQTLNSTDYPSLLQYYAALVCLRSEDLKKISTLLAADAYFSKKPFIDKVCSVGLQIVSRLRDDADMCYPYVGPHPKRPGAKTKYLEKFDPRNLNESYFSCCLEDEEKGENYRVYEGRLYSKSLGREIRVAVLHVYNEDESIKRHKLFFSTDMTLSGCDIYCYYKARFQIEFLYRDAKQYTGLEHCQSKSETKLDFHFNTALTTVNVAKAVYHLSQPTESRTPFSMADVKTEYSNEMMWNLIISKCGICPHSPKLKSAREFVINFGKRRA
jgi:hypothetical protein